MLTHRLFSSKVSLFFFLDQFTQHCSCIPSHAHTLTLLHPPLPNNNLSLPPNAFWKDTLCFI